MNILVFVVLVNGVLVFGVESRTDWVQQYFDTCEKLSGLYQELIEVMENPKTSPLIENGAAVNGDTHRAGNDQDGTATELVKCNHQVGGYNSTGLENGIARVEQLMTVIHTGISDEKRARVQNTKSVVRLEANVEDKLVDLNDETVAIAKHLTDLSDKIGNSVSQLEADVQGWHKDLAADTVAIKQNLLEVSDKVQHVVGFEANIKDHFDVMMGEMALLSKRLTELSNKVSDLDTRIEQDNKKSEQTSLNTDGFSDKLNEMYTAIMQRNNVNVALNKPATQSSTSSNNADVATDGNRNREWRGSSCTHTQTDREPWWKVNLLGQYFINRVVIVNRMDCCGDRLRDLTLTVSNTTDGVETVCGHFKGPSTNGAAETIWCQPGLVGQFVKIQMQGRYGILTMCEVEVY